MLLHCPAPPLPQPLISSEWEGLAHAQTRHLNCAFEVISNRDSRLYDVFLCSIIVERDRLDTKFAH
ncbi:hypothetical protein B996_00436 [Brucella abortus 78/14]|nr:hypothetical protein B996_00436 [Brucella abortus 78/14]